MNDLILYAPKTDLVYLCLHAQAGFVTLITEADDRDEIEGTAELSLFTKMWIVDEAILDGRLVHVGEL